MVARLAHDLRSGATGLRGGGFAGVGPTTAFVLAEHVYTPRRFENGYLLRVADARGGVFVTVDDLHLTIEGFEELAAALSSVLASLHDDE